MKLSHALSVSVFGLLASCLMSVSAVNAIVVSPVIVDQDVAPGMSSPGKLMVTNDGDKTQTYYITVQSFLPQGEDGDQQYLPETDVTGLPSWFKFETTSLVVEPGKSKEISYSVFAPPNAEPGGHYATVFFSSTPEVEGKASSVGLLPKTGIVFLVRVAGDIKEEANVESFNAKQGIYSHLPAMLSLRIRNTGNVHFRPTGTLTVRNMWGGIVARVPANPRKGAVLPNSIRRLDTWWTKSTELAEGGFIAGLTNEWKNFAFGRYTASIDVKYGSKNTALETKETSFWVLPWRMGLILAVLLALLLVIMKSYNKILLSSAMRESKKRK